MQFSINVIVLSLNKEVLFQDPIQGLLGGRSDEQVRVEQLLLKADESLMAQDAEGKGR